MSTRSLESRSHSPDGEPEKRASKKRKVLSCYACRNRKMKCDRVYPVCGRCQKTGRADQCTYDPRLLEDLPVNGDGHVEGPLPPSFAQPDNAPGGFLASSSHLSDGLMWKLRAQERRLELLEKKLAAVDHNKNSLGNAPSYLAPFDVEENEPRIGEQMMFRGKSFKTQFYGSTSPLSLINQFGELQSFTREAMTVDSSMGRIRGDFKGFRNRRKAMLKEKGIINQGTDAEILALLPDKATVDAAVALYFPTFETSHRILHETTFWKEYRDFWEQRETDTIQVSFATVLLLIIAATKCLYTDRETLFIGDSSAERESASNLIDACDAWLMRQSRKHLTLSFFQLHCLSLLAKRVNCVKMKQDWVHCGDMIRLAMAAGMHRNPSFLAGGRITEFEKEMRRRLWATMMELEIQSSIDCGLQSSLCGLYFDAQPPANVPDEMFSPDSEQAPTGRPLDHFTSSSYLIVSMKSLPLRLHLMQLLNNPTTKIQYADVLHYDAQITTMLASLPVWNNPKATIPSALLDLQLRQFLLILHWPYGKLAATNTRFLYSFTACVNVADKILSIYDALIEKEVFSLNHLRNDIFRTGMTVAQLVYHNSSFSSPPHPTAPQSKTDPVLPGNPTKTSVPPGPQLRIPQLPTDNYMAATLCTSSIELMERALSIFEHRVMRLGTGYMEYWILSAALGVMPSSLSPSSPHPTAIHEDIRSRGRKAIDRITRLCFRVLAMQKDPGSDFASSLRGTMATASPPEARSSISVTASRGGVTPFNTGSEISLQSLAALNGIPGASGPMAGLEQEAKEQAMPPGPWDAMGDMQVDMSGWTFPDFWAFDMRGDF